MTVDALKLRGHSASLARCVVLSAAKDLAGWYEGSLLPLDLLLVAKEY